MKYLLAAFLLFTISGCSPDPRDAAEAYAIELQADQDTADQIQARENEEEIHNMEMQEKQTTSSERTDAAQRMLHTASVAGSIALFIAILGAGVGSGWAFVGSGQAAARIANVRANLIPMDHTTRQFPLLLSYAGHGRYTLTEPNTEKTLFLDTRNDSDRQLMAIIGAIRLAGVVTQEASKSKDPAGLALYQPVVIESGEKK